MAMGVELRLTDEPPVLEITWNPASWALRPGAEGQMWTLNYSHPSVDYLMAGTGELVRRGVLHMDWKMAWGDLRRWLADRPERDPMVRRDISALTRPLTA